VVNQPAVSAKAEMLIRRPVAEVFEAFVDPAVTTRFWFTKSEGFALVLAGLKAFLEHHLQLNLVPDRLGMH
jgi:uncharacterized protein YndB with AHSA1/START domain